MPQVAIGVIFHWLGGLASGSFYVPYKAVRKWSWEVYWLAGGFFSWIIAPWVLASILTQQLCPSIAEAWQVDPHAMKMAYLFGCLWGVGGLTFGLTMRFLGMSLGMAVALGLCTVLGTLLPDIYQGTLIENCKTQAPYVVILLGLGVCLLGVILAGIAGMSKEREMPEEVKKASIKEFSFVKGVSVALISGLFSACMAFGLQAAQPLSVISIRNTMRVQDRLTQLDATYGKEKVDALTKFVIDNELKNSEAPLDEIAQKDAAANTDKRANEWGELSTQLGEDSESALSAAVAAYAQYDADGHTLWSGLPKLCVVLLGGFTTNFVWCLLLLLKNGTLYQFFTTTIKDPDNPGEKVKVNWLWNLFFSALAGTTWYFQFFFYSMGETKMGEYKFSSWTLHMASIIIFSSCWGLALREWKGSSKFTKFILGVAIFTLIYSTITVGYGNFMNSTKATGAVPAAVQTLEDGVAEDVANSLSNAANAAAGAVEKAADAVQEVVAEAVETAVPAQN